MQPFDVQKAVAGDQLRPGPTAPLLTPGPKVVPSAIYLMPLRGRISCHQKIAKLGSRFSEPEQGPLKGLGALLVSLAGAAVGFRFSFYGRWADGKCRWVAIILAPEPRRRP